MFIVEGKKKKMGGRGVSSHCGSRASVIKVNRRAFEDLPSRSHVSFSLSSSSITSWLSNSKVISDSSRKLTIRHSTETYTQERCTCKLAQQQRNFPVPQN